MTGRARSRAARPSSAKRRTTKRPAPATVKRTARSANRNVRRAADNPWLKRAARAGYAIRGLLYGTMGVLALLLAFGSNAKTVDQRGTLAMLPSGIIRTVVLLVAMAGLTAYAMWGFIRAAYDPLGRGSDAVGWMARLGFVWSAMNYLALVVFAGTFLVGTSQGDGSDTIRNLVGNVLVHPGGRTVIIISGVIGTIAGIGQFWDAYKAGFRKDLKRNQLSAATRHTVDGLGRVGMVARGFIFSLLGWFILQAGLADDSGRAQSIGQVFRTLLEAPLGHALLAGVAAGFIALGIHSVVLAVLVRMPETAVQR